MLHSSHASCTWDYGVGTDGRRWYIWRRQRKGEMMSCICNVGMSVSVQPCALAPVDLACYPACHSTPGHGHMPLAWPADQHCSSLAWQRTTHALTHNPSNRWMKRWATSCVKWTEGRGVLAIMVKQTAKRDSRVFVCLCNRKRCTGASRATQAEHQAKQDRR